MQTVTVIPKLPPCTVNAQNRILRRCRIGRVYHKLGLWDYPYRKPSEMLFVPPYDDPRLYQPVVTWGSSKTAGNPLFGLPVGITG